MLQDYIDTFAQLGQSLIENPVAVGVPLAIAILLIVLKWRFIGRAERKSTKSGYMGWTQRADQATARHETGIGTKDVQVMKPVGLFKTGLMTLLFFGGGAVFYALIVLQEPDASTKDWIVFAIMFGFSALSILLIVMSFSRIRFDADTITRNALFQSQFSAALSAVSSVTPLSKTLAGGVKIAFTDGRVLKVPARFSGYEDLLIHLSRNDPKLTLLVRMTGSMMKKAL